MKREEIKAIFAEATDEQIKKILGINGADIEGFKSKISKLEDDLKTKETSLKQISSDFEQLKTANASAEDYKKKFEELQADVTKKENEAKAEREKAEHDAEISRRYNAVAVDKDGNPLKWRHDAIKADYLRKFDEALANKDNVGKSDADIFAELTKEDGNAFESARAKPNLAGGNPANFTSLSKEEFAKLGYSDRLKIFNENPDVYHSMTE